MTFTKPATRPAFRECEYPECDCPRYARCQIAKYPDVASASAPEQPADPLSDLVSGFAKALLAKLRLASANGRSGWERDDWEKQCQQGLLRHLQKGDPRDVAAYCAFMWHHNWLTVAPEQPAAYPSAEADEAHADLLRRLAAVPDKEK